MLGGKLKSHTCVLQAASLTNREALEVRQAIFQDETNTFANTLAPNRPQLTLAFNHFLDNICFTRLTLYNRKDVISLKYEHTSQTRILKPESKKHEMQSNSGVHVPPEFLTIHCREAVK